MHNAKCVQIRCISLQGAPGQYGAPPGQYGAPPGKYGAPPQGQYAGGGASGLSGVLQNKIRQMVQVGALRPAAPSDQPHAAAPAPSCRASCAAGRSTEGQVVLTLLLDCRSWECCSHLWHVYCLQVNRLEAFYPPQALQHVFNRLDRVDFKCACVVAGAVAYLSQCLLHHTALVL